jgi:MSHA pilin protein MshA
MKTLQKQAGFTLIELVVVIVILGILAATAAPKFIDLTGDAKSSIVDGVRGALNSAADLVHAKALIQGELASTGAISVGTSTVTLVYGWPDASATGIVLVMDVDDDLTPDTADANITTYTHSQAVSGPTCVATYNDSAVSNAETRPSITSNTLGC